MGSSKHDERAFPDPDKAPHSQGKLEQRLEQLQRKLGEADNALRSIEKWLRLRGPRNVSDADLEDLRSYCADAIVRVHGRTGIK